MTSAARVLPRFPFVALLIICNLSTTLASHAFEWTEEIELNGRKYMDVRRQPWFRNHHRHSMVEAAQKDQSSFGKHFVPDDEPYVAPHWTEEEKKYLPCMDFLCACGFFNGTVVNGNCELEGGVVLKRGLRKEIRTLTEEERIAFETSVNKLKSQGIYSRLGRVHKYSGVHSGPAFVIWHREFLKRVEFWIRRMLPVKYSYLGVPYWDSTMDAFLPDPKDTVMFHDLILGFPEEDGWLRRGPYANWESMEGRPAIIRKIGSDGEGEFLSPARVDWIVDNPDYRAVMAATLPLTTCPTYSMLDDRFLEYSHDYVHFYVGGDMGRSHSSSNDIIFCLHHSMIDIIWELWRQTHQNETARETEYHVSDERCFPPWHFIENEMPMLGPLTNKDGLSNKYTDNLYQFAPRPTCTGTSKECGSRYLFCHTDGDESICLSKVRLGGSCSGFESTEICFEGTCIGGRCTEKQEKKRDDVQFLELNM